MHDQGAAEHDHNGNAEGELQGLVDPVFAPRAVVVGEDGDQSVVKTEDRHEEEALEFEVNAEHCCRRCGESGEDHVHAVSHDGADGHHQNGRDAHGVDAADRVGVGMKDPLPAQVNVFVEFQVHEKTEQGGYTLTQNSCVGGTRYSQPGEAEETEDHDRVEDDVNDGTGRLADHAELCASGGLQQSLKGHLEEEAERETCHEREIRVPVRNNFSRLSSIAAAAQLYGNRPVRQKQREEKERDITAECQENSHVRGGVGSVEALLAERPGEQRVHTYAGTGADGDHQVLQRECISDS